MQQAYTFHQLLNEQINDLYSAEEQIAFAIPKIINVTSSGELRNAFETYALEINHHIENLDSVLKEVKISPKGNLCPAMTGIIEAAEDIIHHGGNSAVKDAALIAVIQRLIHYKIAVYGTTRTFCRHLNYNKSLNLLQQALNQEGEMDHQLTKLAEGGIFTTGINEEACRAKTLI
ncbi:MAG: DUF892 family protein [Parachlamydiaceae bacterium]|nr:DUF892 family protein [Parachlamydiaceae bacterium]